MLNIWQISMSIADDFQCNDPVIVNVGKHIPQKYHKHPNIFSYYEMFNSTNIIVLNELFVNNSCMQK